MLYQHKVTFKYHTPTMMKTFNYILIVAFCMLLNATQTAFSQQVREATIPIKGRVVADDSGNPLEYASITVNNTNISTVTNQDGYFSLRIPKSAENYKLKLAYLGYENLLIPIRVEIL